MSTRRRIDCLLFLGGGRGGRGADGDGACASLGAFILYVATVTAAAVGRPQPAARRPPPAAAAAMTTIASGGVWRLRVRGLVLEV